MKIQSYKHLDIQQKQQIFSLWNTEYPHILSYPNLDKMDVYLEGIINPTHYFLLNNLDETIGWAATFSRENEIWFAIIVDGIYHGKGFGKMLLDELKKEEKQLNGWVIDGNFQRKSNGELYISPLPFYVKNKFEVLSEIRLELDIFSAVKIFWSRHND